ncbi:MAG: hypothetical protein AAF196_07770 [Planctomycetota bacterium]
MFEIQVGTHVVQLSDEECYTPGSADNARSYDREHFAAGNERQAVVGVRCASQSAVLLSPGIRREVDERSVAYVRDSIFVACGSFVFALSLPDLELRWFCSVDVASCFGLHLCGDEPFLISHGEVDITRLTLEGRVVWSACGRDIFTGAFEVRGDHIRAVDFNGDAYVVDLATGEARIAG